MYDFKKLIITGGNTFPCGLNYIHSMKQVDKDCITNLGGLNCPTNYLTMKNW